MSPKVTENIITPETPISLTKGEIDESAVKYFPILRRGMKGAKTHTCVGRRDKYSDYRK